MFFLFLLRIFLFILLIFFLFYHFLLFLFFVLSVLFSCTSPTTYCSCYFCSSSSYHSCLLVFVLIFIPVLLFPLIYSLSVITLDSIPYRTLKDNMLYHTTLQPTVGRPSPVRVMRRHYTLCILPCSTLPLAHHNTAEPLSP